MNKQKEPVFAVPKAWLETLLKLTEKAGQDVLDWDDDTSEEGLPSSIITLVGFTSSVDSILKYNEIKD